MGRVESTPPPAAVEVPLPWGPVIRGVRWGAASDTILLLHEPGADLDAWDALPARLAHTLGIAAVAADLPGHGLSDDPWEMEQIGALVQVLVEELANVPDRATAGRTAIGRRFVISAGAIASAVHASVGRLALAGTVALSPAANPPSPIAMGEGGRGVRVNVPKLFFAGSLADIDLEIARRLASDSTGWSAVTAVPVSERGTRLLATPWRARIEEEIVAFLRDCQKRRPGVRPGPRITPRPAG